MLNLSALRKYTLLLFFVPLTIWWLMPAWEATLSTMRDLSQHMEYIWMIPLLSLFMLWLKRDAILHSFGRPAILPAFLFFLLASGLLFFGLRGEQTRFLQSSAICYLMGMVLCTLGTKTFKQVWFPLLLLAFIMPVGFLDNFTVPLRRASVSATAVLLNGLGIPVQQSGTALYSTNALAPFQMDVADPCSGIRSLVALFVGTAAYGAMTLRSIWGRWLLFLASVPIAFLGNILRLLLTGLVCAIISQKAGMQIHDNALFIIAPVYLLAVFAIADRIKKHERRAPSSDTQPSLPPNKTAHITPRTVRYYIDAIFSLLLLCGLLFFRYWALPPEKEATLEADTFLNKSFVDLPEYAESYPLYCQNRDCLWSDSFSIETSKPATCPLCTNPLSPNAKAELDILPSDTQCYKVTYTHNDGTYFTVSLVIAGASRLSIHRPELCLPSQGFRLSERTVREVLPNLPMALFSIERHGSYQKMGFAYVFLNASDTTVSNLHRVVGDSIIRSLYNRIPRWAMVTISSNVDFLTPAGELALAEFLSQWWHTLRNENNEN